MTFFSVPEFGRIPREHVSRKLLGRLQRFDELHAGADSQCVFDWTDTRYVRALNYVGVVQIPGLQIEILPKIDLDPATSSGPYADTNPDRGLAQHNLLYMLSVTRAVPISERDLAGLRLQKMPLLEALIAIFAERLLRELGKGLARAYVSREGNLSQIKGKLLLPKHLRENSTHAERVYVEYDEFVADIWLNRILKASCRRLLRVSSSTRTQQRLREALLHFAEVGDTQIEEEHFGRVYLNRNTERFKALLDFSRTVLLRRTATPAAGDLPTFSLLFPMEALFEEFIARFLCRYRADLGLDRSIVHVQAAGRREWLLRRSDGAWKFQLRPDVLVDSVEGRAQLILDTKWKRLKSDAEDSRNGVSQSDLYQLFAYANRYECPDNVLLFPKVRGVTPKHYVIPDDHRRKLRIEFVDLSRDLRRDCSRLKEDLRRALGLQG